MIYNKICAILRIGKGGRMKQEKNNNGINLLLVFIIIIIIVILCVLLATGTVSFKSSEVTDSSNNQTKENTNTNNKDSNNIIDLSKLDGFKNSDGSYGHYNSLTFNSWDNKLSYTVALTLDGIVEINDNKKGSNWKKFDINDVTDIISFHNDPSGLGYCYMLTNNNEVYYYDLYNATSNNYEVVKVDTAVDIVKIITISYCPLENAGCEWSLVGIKKDGNYVTIGNGSI